MLEHPLLHQKLVKGTQGGQLADDADPGISLFLFAARIGVYRLPALSSQPGQIAAGQPPVHIGQGATGQGHVAEKGVQVVPIDPDGVVGQTPLAPQVGLIPRNQFSQFIGSGSGFRGSGSVGNGGLGGHAKPPRVRVGLAYPLAGRVALFRGCCFPCFPGIFTQRNLVPNRDSAPLDKGGICGFYPCRRFRIFRLRVLPAA